MIKILEEVAAQRLKLNTGNFVIQISQVFMNKALIELNKMLGSEKYRLGTSNGEFTYTFFGKEFKVKNREYRDDTNDKDVEEIIYEFAIKSND